MKLFADRAFEEVSVVEVASAAGVTEKTVFNHFASKEDLVYSGDDAFESALLDAATQRPQGVTVLAATRAFLLGIYSLSPRDPSNQMRALTIARLIHSSPTLRARERATLARYTDRLRAELERELGVDEWDLRPAVAAAAIVAVHRGVIDGHRRGLLAAEPPRQLSQRMLVAAEAAFDLIDGGLAALIADR